MESDMDTSISSVVVVQTPTMKGPPRKATTKAPVPKGKKGLKRLQCTRCPKDYASSATLRQHLRTHLLREASVCLPSDEETLGQCLEKAPAILQEIADQEVDTEGDAAVQQIASALKHSISKQEEAGVVFVLSAGLCICEVMRSRGDVTDSTFLHSLSESGTVKELGNNHFFTSMRDHVQSIAINYKIKSKTDWVDNCTYFFLRKLTSKIAPSMVSNLFKAVSQSVPRTSNLGLVSESESKTIYYASGSIVKGDERRHSLKSRLDPASFTNGADDVPSAISDFTLAQNRGGLKLPNLEYYQYARSLISILKAFVWKDLISMSHDAVFQYLLSQPEVLTLWNGIAQTTEDNADASSNSFEFYTRKVVNLFMRGLINKLINRENPRGSINIALRTKLASGLP